MCSKIAIISAFFAALAAATPMKLNVARQSAITAGLVNSLSDGTTINYAVISEAPPSGCVNNCVVTSGSVAPGNSVSLPFNPTSEGGYSVKLCSGSCDPATQGANGILQYEYTLSSDGSEISYDWSCVNCDPDPFAAYTYTMAPFSGAQTTPDNGPTPGECATLTCDANAQSTAEPCYYYAYNGPTSGEPPNCELNGATGDVLIATFSS